MKNFSDMMRQAQEMQGKMAEAQERLEDVMVKGTAGADMVQITMTAKGALQSVTIDSSLFNGEDKEVVEDLIVAAHGDAKIKAEAAAAEEMAKVTSGMNLPAGMKLPL